MSREQSPLLVCTALVGPMMARAAEKVVSSYLWAQTTLAAIIVGCSAIARRLRSYGLLNRCVIQIRDGEMDPGNRRI